MTRARRVALLAPALGWFAFGWLAFGHALASDCILDNCEDRRPAVPSHVRADDRLPGRRNGSGPRGASVPGRFDFYVLSLSWSPGFCAIGGDAKSRDQCRRGADIGFTVHGLWPQYERGYPSDCPGAGRVDRAALAETDGVYPAEGLARYEWRKHGTCSGLSPSAYFAAARAARDAVAIPARFKDPHGDQTLAPSDVERAFADANPRLRPGMLAAICQHGTLDEVRVCFSRDLTAFQACPDVVGEGCRDATLFVPAVR